jgi:hypothetical protein
VIQVDPAPFGLTFIHRTTDVLYFESIMVLL